MPLRVGVGGLWLAPDGETHELCKGSHFIAPCDSGDLRFTGNLTLITSHV